MGSYCKFCGQRCFVVRVIPDGPAIGRTFALATCQGGMAHDLERVGYTHLTAINPVAEPDAVRAVAAETQ